MALQAHRRQSVSSSASPSTTSAPPAAAPSPSSSMSPTASAAGYHHAPPTHADMELLDMLTSMPSSFPHAPHPPTPSSPSSASHYSVAGPYINGKRRPLATLSALRRPPIDPIILAASLSSGPHVTRHHFHHTYGEKAHGPSHQMPARQRRALVEAQQREQREQRQQQQDSSQYQQSTQHQHLPQHQHSPDYQPLQQHQQLHQHRPSQQHQNSPHYQHEQQHEQQYQAGPSTSTTSRSRAGSRSSPTAARSPRAARGSYANCDMTDEDEEELLEAVDPLSIPPVPEVTASELALYASKQAPRSVRLKREEEERKAREALIEKRRQEEAEREKARVVAQEAEQQRIQREKEEAERAHKAELAKAAEIARSTTIRASSEAPSATGQPQASAPSGHTANSGVSALLKQALAERQAIASAPTTPSLPSTPSGFQHNPLEAGGFPKQSAPAAPQLARLSSIVRPPPLQIRCYARTRIPTPHGEIFCHLYRNNRDNKEHLALVVDPMQNEPDVNVQELANPTGPQPLRSRTLDEKWSPEETEMERIVRGAYVGRLGPNCQVASQALPRGHSRAVDEDDEWEAPLVRIHSECYTGETIGSQRCDCGEQLDEALRLILHSGSGSEPSSSSSLPKQPRLPRGVVVYLRQEGRGIGLLDKLMAYNLQDMGHDTVSANVLLGHLPDARQYAAAAAILEDLGVRQCRLLTNNPEKMEALEAEGVAVKERMGMVPRAWTQALRQKKKKTMKKKSKKSKKKSKKAHASKSKVSKSSRSKDPPPSEGDSIAAPSSLIAQHRRRQKVMAESQDLSHSIMSQLDSAGDDSVADLDTDGDSISHPHPKYLGRKHQGSDVESGSELSASYHADDVVDGELEDSSDDEESDSGDSEESGSESESESGSDSEYRNHLLRSSGATLIGGSAARGAELERYLRTKVERMGHLLDLPQGEAEEKVETEGSERKQ